MLVLSDNSGYYVIQEYNGSIPHILKYSFSSSTNQQYIPSGLTWHAFGTLMISDTELFWITRTTSPLKMAFTKLTFEVTPANWANQISCLVSNCYIWYSSALLSEDNSAIYSMFDYEQSSVNIYFSSFKTSDGAIIGNSYISTSWSSFHSVYGLVLNGENIVATLLCTSWNLVIYNIPNSSFTFKLFSGGSLYDWEVENGSNR